MMDLYPAPWPHAGFSPDLVRVARTRIFNPTDGSQGWRCWSLPDHRAALRNGPLDPLHRLLMFGLPIREFAQAPDAAASILKAMHDVTPWLAGYRGTAAGREARTLALREDVRSLEALRPPASCEGLCAAWLRARCLVQAALHARGVQCKRVVLEAA